MSQRRRLGINETTYKFLHDHANGCSTISAMAKVSGPLSPEVLQRAFMKMQERHPMLRARIGEPDEKYDYLEIADEPGNVPLRVIKRTSDEQWQDVFEQNMAEPFADGELLWRANLITGDEGDSEDHELVMGFHHCMFDGISAGSFFGQLLDYCQDQPAEVKSLPLLPSWEHLAKKRISWRRSVIWFTKDYTIEGARYMKYFTRYEKYVPADRRTTKNIYCEVDERQLQSLLGLCRENRVTLTSLLTSALIMAASDANDYRDRKGRSGQVVGTALSTRELCSPEITTETLGCFVGSDLSGYRFDDKTSVWVLARSFNKKLSERLEHYRAPAEFSKKVFTNTLTVGDNWPIKKKFHAGVGVTNVGRLDYSSQIGPFTVKRFYFCPSQNEGGLLMLLNVATLENRLFLNFCYTDPLISEQTANTIVTNCTSVLDSLSR